MFVQKNVTKITLNSHIALTSKNPTSTNIKAALIQKIKNQPNPAIKTTLFLKKLNF